MKFKERSGPSTAGAAFFAMFALTTLAANADVGVTVNGSAVDVNPPPIVQAGRVFVPLRGVFEQLGASVVYSDGTINATGNGRDISLQIGSTQATVNGQPQTIDVAPFIVGASTYVPLRFISEALGDSVSWDDADSIAAIDTGGGPADYYSPGTASYVDTAPPPLPAYQQPVVPAPDYIWQPGYWAWGAYGYYWVPGTWVPAAQPGYLWTPGYWQGTNDGFHWNPGYWASAVGFYGGINYGNGYYGNGYNGGRWSDNRFRYNSYVSHVDPSIVQNVYVDRNVYVNNSTTRIDYNGGRYGVAARPTAVQLGVAKQRHLGMTLVQQQHVRAAELDRRLLARVNNDRPPITAVARPLSKSNPPPALVPVKPADRVNPLANVAPARLRAAPVARPATHANLPRAALPAQRTPVMREAAPAAHRPATVSHAAPLARARVIHEAVPAGPPPAAIRVAAPVARPPAVHVAAPVARPPAVYAATRRHVRPVGAVSLHAPVAPRAAAPRPAAAHGGERPHR